MCVIKLCSRVKLGQNVKLTHVAEEDATLGAKIPHRIGAENFSLRKWNSGSFCAYTRSRKLDKIDGNMVEFLKLCV